MGLEVNPPWRQGSNGRGRPRKYEWDTVEVGKSFFVPKERQTCDFRSFQAMAYAAGQRHGRKFFVRVVPEGEPNAGAFQCWRSR